MNTTPTARRISIGDTFPDVELVDHTGSAWRPSDAAGRPIVLILHRHLA